MFLKWTYSSGMALLATALQVREQSEIAELYYVLGGFFIEKIGSKPNAATTFGARCRA